MLLARGDAGFGVSHADAFATWLKALLNLIACDQFYVVFDNKRGGGASSAPIVSDIRRAAVPNYLDNRHAKLRRKQQQGLTAGSVGGAGGGDGGSPGTRQQRSSAAGGAVPVRHPYDSSTLELRRTCEALMDRPPPYLYRFVRIVRQLGGLVLYGLPGHEADDLIASLVEGLLSSTGSISATATAPRGTTMGPAAAATDATDAPAAAAACRVAGRVAVISADSDMLQLLRRRRCAWLEVRQLSSATSSQEACPLAVRAAPLAVPPAAAAVGSGGGGDGCISEALLRLHEAVDTDATDGGGADGGAGGSQRHIRAQGSSPVLLPPAVYPDYLALVGKTEAGVSGAGVSGRAARKLLSRYGSVHSVVQAYVSGALDGALRPVAAAGGGSGAGTRGPGSGPNTACTRYGEQDAYSGDGTAGDGGGCGDQYPPAVRQVLRNIQVTRMRVDLASVPWERVREYQQWRRRRRQASTPPPPSRSPPPRQRAAGSVTRGAGPAWGSRVAESGHAAEEVAALVAAEAGAEALPPLHPHDLLHASSAAPFVSALVDVLRRRGLTCRTNVVDEQGLLADIVVVDPSAAGAAAAAAGSVPAAAEEASAVEVASARQHSASSPRASRYDVDAAADALASLLAQRRPPSSAATVVAAAGSGPRGLRVCVLSPWDFKHEVQQQQHHQKPGPLPKQQQQRRGAVAAPRAGTPAAVVSAPAAAAGTGSPSGLGSDGKGGGQGGEQKEMQQQQQQQQQEEEQVLLVEFAGRLQAAIGRRPSPAHTPKALQAALRPTTAWRLKRMQRSATAAETAETEAAGGVTAPLGAVAVVPFYELVAVAAA